jgi:hypothetical protein
VGAGAPAGCSRPARRRATAGSRPASPRPGVARADLAAMMRPARDAPVAESVDAADSKSVTRKGVGVRVSPGAPIVSVGWRARAGIARNAKRCASSAKTRIGLPTKGQRPGRSGCRLFGLSNQELCGDGADFGAGRVSRPWHGSGAVQDVPPAIDEGGWQCRRRRSSRARIGSLASCHRMRSRSATATVSGAVAKQNF